MFFPYRVETDDLESEAERKSFVTYGLIIINVALFCLYQFLPAKDMLVFFHGFGFVPEEKSWLTGFTYMFLHANWLHIIGNMYFLWLFGRALESSLGYIRFLALYILAGVVAVLVHSAFVAPELADVPCLGASGAISGILGAFLALLPGVHIECVLMLGLRPTAVVRPKAVIVLGVWFVLQLFEQWIAQGQNSSSIAYGAHIGGFLFGWAAVGTLRVAKRAAMEWHALAREADLRSWAATINAGTVPDGAAAADINVQRMLFLKHGSIPQDQAVLNSWLAGLHPDNDAATSASVVLRANLENHPQALDAESTATGADAIARLGYSSVALACLLDGLERTNDGSAQHLLCTIAIILWRDLGDRDKATRCLEDAIAIDPDSETAGKARRVLEKMSAAQPAQNAAPTQ